MTWVESPVPLVARDPYAVDVPHSTTQVVALEDRTLLVTVIADVVAVNDSVRVGNVVVIVASWMVVQSEFLVPEPPKA